jgi:NAD(P)-dependent dehydrogenase (short-subunit alcohol dehydrogenase family)
MDVEGKVALVTGAASGIGRATAVALAAAGARVMVADLDEIGGVETVRHIQSAGGEASFEQADVSRPHGIRAMFDAVHHVYGGVDIVHNNAGLVAGSPGWPAMDLERIHLQVDVNLAGVCMGTQEALVRLRERGGGTVVNTASVAALQPLPEDPVYAATKAAVVSFTKACAPLAAEGIRVNCVLPGVTDTPILNKTGDGTAPAPWFRQMMVGVPVLTPEEVAAVVLALVRDDSAAGEARVVGGLGRGRA